MSLLHSDLFGELFLHIPCPFSFGLLVPFLPVCGNPSYVININFLFYCILSQICCLFLNLFKSVIKSSRSFFSEFTTLVCPYTQAVLTVSYIFFLLFLFLKLYMKEKQLCFFPNVFLFKLHVHIQILPKCFQHLQFTQTLCR